MTGGPASVVGNRNVKQKDTKTYESGSLKFVWDKYVSKLSTGNFVYIDVTEKTRDNSSETFLNTEDHHKHGVSVEFVFYYPPKKLKKNKHFQFCPGKKIELKDFSEYTMETKALKYKRYYGLTFDDYGSNM